ncbi:hypothetical protein AB0G74_33665 [Streptomyces sp. NPDC020875]|uniref:hypothetical protein n=1 Tax=Streptomyces sp. NPDC020875 TaxID=3154898 RepID=UPI0033C9150E
MRTTERAARALVAPLLTLAAILVGAVPEAVSQNGPAAEAPGPGESAPADSAAGAGTPEPYRAECRTETDGSYATAYCHNPYPVTDRVRLHIECDRWWDVDVDGPPVDIGPAQYVELTDRCWQRVRAVWVTHLPFGGRSDS